MEWPDIIPILPEIIVTVAALLVLLVEPFLKMDKTAVIAIALVGVLASAVVAIALGGQVRSAFSGMIVLNTYAVFFKVLFAAAAFITILMSPRYLEAGKRHLGEYYALVLFALIGMDLLAAARDFVAFYVALELMAISSYLLAGFFRYRIKSNESALKYFVTGTFASAFTLFGVSIIYGLTGSTNYENINFALAGAGNGTILAFATAMVVAGLGFKVSMAPFHMWTPDVYQGAPTTVAAFFSVGPKAAGFSAILIIFATVFEASAEFWRTLFIVLSVITMFVGSVMAIVQTNMKRMLAYSSITHVGYLLAGLAALGKGSATLAGESIMLYLAAYTVMNLGAFGILTYLKNQRPDDFDYSLKSFAGLGRRSPWAAVLLTLFLFSLTGIPGTAGFIGKFYLFSAVVRADLVWLAVLAVIFSGVSAYYYLRLMVYMFFKEPETDFQVAEPIQGSLAAAVALSAVGVLYVGLFPSWIWDNALRAFSNFFG
jgi:NADH-quinone oxidoreductase subunit N